MNTEATTPETVSPVTAVMQEAGATGAELARQIDALSLAQALLDFEMANARVLDLTARLVEANERVVRFGRQAAEAVEAQRVAEAALATARSDVATLRAEVASLAHGLAQVRPEIDVLHRELDAHRAVIAARDADAVMFHREIAARDEVIRTRVEELAALRRTRTFRLASRLAAVARRRG